jgi:6-phospho-beta-glucosidase
MKIAVIGGGSTYTPELISGFLLRVARLPLTELWLMDIDLARLKIVGGFARRMLAAAGSPFRLECTTDRQQAIDGASYVITQLRVGQMAARRADEYLGRLHGLIGQETTGVGGMAKALRTIPVILDVAGEMQRSAPGALLVNFTNPSGLITEALQRHAPNVPSVGVCNVAVHALMDMLDLLKPDLGDIPVERARLKTLGLNHLSWHSGLEVDGEDLWPQVLRRYIARLMAEAEPEWDPGLIETLRLIPNYYLHYYYDMARKLAEQQGWPPSRAEEVMELESDLLRQYADPGLLAPPADLMKRGGAYYSTVATELISAHHNDSCDVHVVNTRHGGAVPGWPADWVLELPCRIGRDRIEPLPAEPLPAFCFGLLAQVKAYELFTVEAAVKGDREAAYEALLAHPLGPPSDRIPAVLNDILSIHRIHLPQFWPEN